MIYTHSLDYAITSEHTEIPAQTGRLETRVPGGASSIPGEQHTRLPWQPTSHHIYSGPEGHTDTNNKTGNRIYQGMSHYDMGHNGHGINMYGVIMTLMGNLLAGGQSSLGHLTLLHRPC